MLGATTVALHAQVAPDPQIIEQLLALDLDQLLNLDVTSAARKPQKLAETASAVYIITQDDIRRSGVTNIPEALRLAPGVQVARIGADKWAITIRGFNGRFSNKLLVLMDGRSVYDPLYSGVFWNAQDYVLEDIERIEIVRGPGAALWGANAVNGVINIITKPAEQTQGMLVATHAGTEDRGGLAMRYGGRWGEDTAYRVYAKGFKREASITLTGQDANDAWQSEQAGFRVDSRLSAEEQFTVQGDMHRDVAGDLAALYSLSPPYGFQLHDDWTMREYNFLTRYRRRTGTTDNTLQLYYSDSFKGTDADVKFDVRSFDLDWQQQLLSTGRHDWLWGLGYRWLQHSYNGEPYAMLQPEKTDWQLFSGFAQDEIELTPQWFLTLGAKLEHNDTTGWEFQPSARLLWSLAPNESLWAAISRAVRTPSRAEAGVIANYQVFPPFSPGNPGDLPVQVRVFGDPAIESETVIAYEAGWRRQWDAQLSTDLALFWNDYDQLRSVTPGAPFLEFASIPHLVLPFTLNNALSGHTYGLEMAVDWRPHKNWRLQGSYSYLRMSIDDSGSTEGSSPRHQFSLLSSLALSPRVELSAWLRLVDELPALGIPAYTSLDARLAWSPLPDLTFSLVGQNLLDDRHPEFNADAEGQVLGEIERNIYLKALWRF
ncbi:MAG: TonB-dependent receptor [Candidatus Competibacteraceae bacterium]|nr:TonB-dependent receptor [Candidatus Competibacteraceae bacterium]